MGCTILSPASQTIGEILSRNFVVLVVLMNTMRGRTRTLFTILMSLMSESRTQRNGGMKEPLFCQRELEGLISDLSKSAEDACRMDEDSRKKKGTKKKKVFLPGEIFDAIKEHTETANVKESVKEREIYKAKPKDVEVVEFTDGQRDTLALQMSQHIQLLTQMTLMASHNPMWSGVKAQCRSMLDDVMSHSLQTAGSVASQSNLVTSLSVIEQWDKTGEDPTAVVKNK